MKTGMAIFFTCLIMGTVHAQTPSTTTVPDSLSFVPENVIQLQSLSFNLPSSSLLLKQGNTLSAFAGDLLNSFQFRSGFNAIPPLYSRGFDPSTASEYESLLRRNYLVLDIHPIVNEW